MAGPLKLRVTMLGGRRAGKTSVLAAMLQCFDREFRNTDINILQADGTTLDAIEAKKQEMENYLADASKNKPFVPDDNPTDKDNTYTFDLKLKDKPDVIKLEFYDFPGEWLTAQNPNYELLGQRVKESDVLMIIVDSPFLMEEDGQYNDVRNRTTRIDNLIKQYLDFSSSVPKMVLFVPVKCEAYYDKGEISRVSSRIRGDRCYGSLISHLKGNCEVAITPILTIGTAAFGGFDFDSATGHWIMRKEVDGMEFPAVPLYHFTPKASEAARRQNLQRKYAADPVFCEQPAVYIFYYALTYAANVAKIRAQKAKKGIWGVLDPKHGVSILKFVKGVFKIPVLDLIPDEFLNKMIEQLMDRYNFASADDYLAQRDIVRKKLKDHGDGYEILSDILYFRGE